MVLISWISVNISALSFCAFVVAISVQLVQTLASTEVPTTVLLTGNETESVPVTTTPENVGNRLCAFMNVTHNSSYEIFDRENYSEALDRIHSSVDIFEDFINIVLEPECEATICELTLLDPSSRKRRCFNLNHSHDFTKDLVYYPDPLTKNYFVSTACSCKAPPPNCHTASCDATLLGENECGKLYKEPSCRECRYDAITLREFDSFVPTNGFWCQSYIVREGCRLSIDKVDENGTIISNFENYTGIASNTSLNYIRKPYPPKFTCVCDVEIVRSIWVWHNIVLLCLSMLLLFSVVSIVLKKFVRIRVEQKMSKEQLEDMLRRFRLGLIKDAEDHEEKDLQYLSVGHYEAIQQPYANKLEIPRDRIKIDKTAQPLGVGQYGAVYYAEMISSQEGNGKLKKTQPVAAKVPKLTSLSCFSSVLDEIKILAYIGSHPNICQLIGACTEEIPEKDVLIILEYCSEGNLKTYLRKNKPNFLIPVTPKPTPNIHYVALGHLGYASVQSLNITSANGMIKPDSFKQLLSWSNQIASGMAYLSSKQVIHIDLAARNVLLDYNLHCKVGDFGLSQRIQDVVNYVRLGDEYMLPFRWMPLEALTDLKFTTASDVYSFGILLWEIFSLGDDPFAKIFTLSDLIQRLHSGDNLAKPSFSSDELYHIMLECWQIDAMQRPTFEHLQHLLLALS